MAFGPKDTRHHQIARFSFVPWLARFLGQGPVRAESEPLPVGEPGSLTDETVDAIRVLANQACWQFLARECGWRKMDAVVGDDRHSIRRLWQAELPRLEFSDATVDLLLSVFNATLKGGVGIEISEMPDASRTNGDLLVNHLLFRRILANPELFGVDQGYRWVQWYPNPLNCLIDPSGYRFFDSDKVNWGRLFEPDFVGFLPWINQQVAVGWQEACDDFWEGGLDSRARWLRAMVVLFADFSTIAEQQGRVDLLNGWASLLQVHERSAKGLLNEFEVLAEGLQLQEREPYARVWAEFIRMVDLLDQFACRSFDTHPAERTGAQACFLAQWQAGEFRQTVNGLRLIAQELRPSFN